MLLNGIISQMNKYILDIVLWQIILFRRHSSITLFKKVHIAVMVNQSPVPNIKFTLIY